MTMREWIRAGLTRKTAWLAACALPFLILCVLALSSQHYWRHRASALESANLNLQLRQLAHDITKESDQLIDRAREFAEFAPIAQLVQDNSAASPDRAALLNLARHSVDSLLVVSASQAVRFSAALSDDRVTEEAPAPEMFRFLEEAVSHQPASVGFAADRWIVVRPIMSRASPAAVVGWVAVARSISAPVLAEWAHAVSGSLTAGPLRSFDASALPQGLLTAAANRSAEGFDVTTHMSPDNSSGFAALRDAAGRPVRVFRLAAVAPGGGIGLGLVFGALAVSLAIAALGLIAFRRHTRQQKSVDARYKAIIDQANDGIVIVDAHTQEVLYTNPAFLSRLGYTQSEANTLSLQDIFAD